MMTAELLAEIEREEWLLATDTDDDVATDISENTRLNPLARNAAARRELEFRSRRGLTRPTPMFGIPREYLDDLKSRVRIEDEIGIAIQLRQHGTTYRGLCPFHNDHDPSLTIWPASQSWWCYPYNAGGDVLAWVQAWLRTDFHGAVAYLAGRWGMPLHQSVSRQGSDR